MTPGKETTCGQMRSIPLRTVTNIRAMHDVRHQGSIRHGTGGGDEFRRLERLSQERERLHRRLLIWIAQKERTEAQIAALEQERKHILSVLKPTIGKEAQAWAEPIPPMPLGREQLRRRQSQARVELEMGDSA